MLFPLVAANPDLPVLTLACDGIGFIRASALSAHDEKQPAHLVIEIVDGHARLLLPAFMVPTIHSGGDQGWWPILDASATDDQITGRVRLNFIDKPTLRIDRRSGAVELAGGVSVGFNGQCSKQDPTERRF